MSRSSQPLHTGARAPREHDACSSLLALRPRPPRRGRAFSGGRRLPADPAAQLQCLALVLALLEPTLDHRAEDHDEREEADQPEREEGDHLVVGLAVDALAVVAGERRGGKREPENEGGERQHPHPVELYCAGYRARQWPTSRSPASSRSPRGAGTSTSGTTSARPWCSTAFSSPRSSTRRITASSRRRSAWTATRST